MIKSIELYNWKTHRHTQIDFRGGVNVLIGIMGAGKSSIMDAISFALFGSFPDLASKRVTLAGLITNRPKTEDFAEVRLGLSIDGSEYMIRRKISASSSSEASIAKDGKYLQTQPERVNEAVEGLLKVNYDTFSRAIYAQQNRIDYFLDLAKGERKKAIDEMLGLDSFSRAEENSTSLVNSIRALIDEDSNMLSSINVSELAVQLRKLEAERAAYAAEQEQLSKARSELKEKETLLSGRLAALRKEFDRKRKLADEIVKVASETRTLKAELAKLEALGLDGDAVRSELAVQRSLLKGGQTEQDALREAERAAMKLLSSKEAALMQASKELAERSKLVKELEGMDADRLAKGFGESAAAVESLRVAILSDKGKLAEETRWAAELEEHLGTCPLCERELTDQMRISLKAQKEGLIKALADAISSNGQKLKAEEGAARALKEQLDAAVSKKERLLGYSTTQADADRLASEREAAAKKHEEAAKLFDAKGAELKRTAERVSRLESDIEKLESIRSYSARIATLGKQLDEAHKADAAIGVDQGMIDGMQSELASIMVRLSEALSKHDSNAKFLISLDSQLADKKKSIESVGRAELRIESRRHLLHSMNKFKTSLVETEAILRNRLVNSLNEIIQSVWPELYPYADYSGIRLEAKKDDYLLEANVRIGDADSWIPIDTIASGGERSIASLAMRIALSMVIVPNLRWLILDEPTHNIDSNGIEKLINVLGDRLPHVVEQVFVITHDEALKQIGGAAVYVLERDKEAHSPTSVSLT